MPSSVRVLSRQKLNPFLKRHMQISTEERDMHLDEFLKLVLEKANAFVPSESGSIYLDDPASKTLRYRDKNMLSLVACFGTKAARVLGKKFPAFQGIIGQVYMSGKAYFSRNVSKDPIFTDTLDRLSGKKTRSVLCVPISMRNSMVGVLELVNKEGKEPFSAKDFELLRIFADYISASIQNFLDAKRHSVFAKQDNLTGLSNDRQFHAVLKKQVSSSWRSKKEMALLFIDLDSFKEVNDEHGHLAGSRVLMEVAQVLKESVNVPLAEVARYGGDEFVVILPKSSIADAVMVAEDLRSAIERAIFLKKATVDVPAHHIKDQITASVGIACLHAHVGSNDRNKLIKAADEAMYVSKRNGRNRVTVASQVGKTTTVKKPEANC